MIRQAVQTLTGRAGDAVDTDPYEDSIYLGNESQQPETEAVQDGQDDNPYGNTELEATVQRLAQQMDTLAGRLSEKDRYIGQLEGENQTLRSVPLQVTDAGRQPTPEPDPVLDPATAQLFAEKYKESPEEALVALADHMGKDFQARMDTSSLQQQQVQQVASKLQGIERNILRQVDLALNTYGPAAQELVGDFLDLVRQGNGSSHAYAQTWLGQELAADKPLAETSQGVYRLIESEALRRQRQATAEPQPEQYGPRPAQPGAISRPSAPSRHVATPSDGSDEIPIEDRIGDAIVAEARGEDAAVRNLFRG